MTHNESNGHVTDDVTWPWNVKVLIPMLLEANISKTAGDTGFVPKDHQSHAHTVVWECCKDDRQSQWEMAKFDPQPKLNP